MKCVRHTKTIQLFYHLWVWLVFVISYIEHPAGICFCLCWTIIQMCLHNEYICSHRRKKKENTLDLHPFCAVWQSDKCVCVYCLTTSDLNAHERISLETFTASRWNNTFHHNFNGINDKRMNKHIHDILPIAFSLLTPFVSWARCKFAVCIHAHTNFIIESLSCAAMLSIRMCWMSLSLFLLLWTHSHAAC